MNDVNIILETDSYKLGHAPMYPANTTKVYSYFESRKGAKFPYTTFVTLQPILKEYLEGQVVTMEKIDEAQDIVDKHLGPGVFNRKGWEYILREHGGRLPIKIKAVPEGMRVPTSNVLFTVESTDPECFWLTNYLESILSHVWYGSTIATLSSCIKDMLIKYYKETSDDETLAGVDWQLHNFGYRSVTGVESAQMNLGHALYFNGTDTVSSMRAIRKYYGGDVCQYSVNASEHSIMTAEGEEGEFNVVERLLDNYPTGILSVVIDSYNYKRFIEVCGTRFKDRILARDGKFVFRPDSGDPSTTSVEVAELIIKYFGCSVNTKGYRVFNPKVGMLWGDGVNYESIGDILDALKNVNISTENIVLGCGSALVQQINRDTQRNAFKSSYQERNGVGYNIFKNPLDASKRSKKGRLALLMNNGVPYTLEECDPDVIYEDDLLKTVFLDGRMITEYTFDEVKANANS